MSAEDIAASFVTAEEREDTDALSILDARLRRNLRRGAVEREALVQALPHLENSPLSKGLVEALLKASESTNGRGRPPGAATIKKRLKDRLASEEIQGTHNTDKLLRFIAEILIESMPGEK